MVAHDPHYLYHAQQFTKDVRDLDAAIEIAERRKGQLLILSLGRVAGRLLGDMELEEAQHGVDLPDGQGGHVYLSVVELI